MARSLNKVILIGNLTKDVELRYTPQGSPVATFGIATNRTWKVGNDLKEDAEFHNVVAWNKLAELCSQLLVKGSRVYVEGRLQTRDWVDTSGQKRYKTEIVILEMIFLGGKSKNGNVSEDSYMDHSSDESASGSSSDMDIADELSNLDLDSEFSGN